MTVVAVTGYDSNYEELNKVSIESKKAYFYKQKITLVNYYLTKEVYNRPLSWNKIKLIEHNLKHGSYYVLWMDCDTCIINDKLPLEHFLFNNISAKNKDIAISLDINGINCGVMAFKNTPFVIDLLDKVWSMTEYIDHHWWEQAAINELYKQNWNGIIEKTEFVPQNIFNAYEYSQYDLKYKEGEICDKTFIAHFPALPIAKRIDLINKYSMK
jgi:hypothetical protein